ncbi:MAG: hypothetical protein JO293_09055 [Candidatus Eremiobacteraeota bacterium]|nr:hypothetical protein [Candidatus Eremiobacteraeota bacterium]
MKGLAPVVDNFLQNNRRDNRVITNPSYRALSIVLYVISALVAIIGLILIFMTGWVLGWLPALMPTAGNTGLLIVAIKAIGIFELTYGYLLCVAARDPVKYVATVDSLIFLLLAAALLNIYGVTTLQLGLLYPSWYLIARAILQLILAGVLYMLRPKNMAGAG